MDNLTPLDTSASAGTGESADMPIGNQADSLSVMTECELEERHLKYCIDIIRKNIEDYSIKLRDITAETKELYDNYRSANPELHNDLVIGLDFKSQYEAILNRNLFAVKKPYFGRIDYLEHEDGSNVSLYIGKKGVNRNINEILVVDWRAPIASVYYESEIGPSSYHSPEGERMEITLNLKRTYEIEEGRLIDFYDSDVVTNDEFLTRYLSKNKEVVLGEIIATIQKEQNDIIRDTPWHSVIVQGVAGSGKTTVAMHRISYILYNYKEKFRPDEFFIIGSNKMLLGYITGVLPNLDVYNVNQMTMEEFFLYLLDSDFDLKKGKYTLSNSFLKLTLEPSEQESISIERKAKSFRGSVNFIKALELYLNQFTIETLVKDDIYYGNEVIYSQEDILYFLSYFQEKPLQEKIDLLNKRLIYKIKTMNEEGDQKKEIINAEVKKYKNYFGNRNKKFNLMDIYTSFLSSLKSNRKFYLNSGIELPEYEVLDLLDSLLRDKKVDLYDLAMLSFIKKRVLVTKDYDFVSHIVVDEAQDFGVMVFQICRMLFSNCTFTIMGDVSQNIYYDTGMNDWEALRNEVFHPDKDKFYVLAKSYRNTVEISDYASRILKKCTFQTYDIQPIIRHGKGVSVKKVSDEAEMVRVAVDTVQDIRREGYDTIAIICRTVEETLQARRLLQAHMDIVQYNEDMEQMTFTSGTMILPIHMTKGLEFDAVILWNPDESSYRTGNEDAKLLYVAVTRALHELHIIYLGKLSRLLE